MIEYTHEGIELEAALAPGNGKAPTIFIFHAWRGRDDFVLEKAKYLASLGYTGVALDMYGKGVLALQMKKMQSLWNLWSAIESSSLHGWKQG